MPDLMVVKRERAYVVLEVQRGEQSTDYFENVIMYLRWIAKQLKIDEANRAPRGIEEYARKNAQEQLLEYLNPFFLESGLLKSRITYFGIHEQAADINIKAVPITIELGEKLGAHDLTAEVRLSINLGKQEISELETSDIDYRIEARTILYTVSSSSPLRYFLRPAMQFILPGVFSGLTMSEGEDGFPVILAIDQLGEFVSFFANFYRAIPEEKLDDFLKMTKDVFFTEHHEAMHNCMKSEYAAWLHEIISKTP